MNRRNFITSSALCAGALSLVPTSVFSSTSVPSIYNIGHGFRTLTNQISHVSIESLSYELQESYKKLALALNVKGYNYDAYEVVKFSSNCFAIPLCKAPLLGFKSSVLALLIGHNGDYKHYILNEQTTTLFSALAENYTMNSNTNGLHLNVLEFITPIQVIEESSGKTNVFIYKNKSGNTITLRSSNKKQVILVN